MLLSLGRQLLQALRRGAGYKALLTRAPAKASALVLIFFYDLIILFLKFAGMSPPCTGNSGFPSQMQMSTGGPSSPVTAPLQLWQDTRHSGK